MTSQRLISREGSVLVVIDVQDRLLPIIVDKERLVNNIMKLVEFAKIVNMPIILTEQYPKGLGRTIKEVKELLPDVQPIEKTAFNCFSAVPFKEKIRAIGASTLIIIGIEAHICVCQTALDAVDDYHVCVVSDAVSSHAQEDLATGLERMKTNGVAIASTDMLMYELIGDAESEVFKKSRHLLKGK